MRDFLKKVVRLLLGYHVVVIANQEKTIMQSRDRTEIVRQILDIANSAEGITKTKLMYNAFLSYRQLKGYLTLLTDRDLLRYDSITQTYKTTEKGVGLVQFCNELEEMMKKVSQS
jgi:predicted transcriptional regulator